MTNFVVGAIAVIALLVGGVVGLQVSPDAEACPACVNPEPCPASARCGPWSALVTDDIDVLCNDATEQLVVFPSKEKGALTFPWTPPEAPLKPSLPSAVPQGQ